MTTSEAATTEPAESQETAPESTQCFVSFFEEAAQCLAWVVELCKKFSDSVVLVNNGESGNLLKLADSEQNALKDEERLVNELIKILEKYQELPHLLDPHLEALVSPIINRVRDAIVATQELRPNPLSKPDTAQGIRLHRLLRILYYLTKVRGWKTVVKFFTHEPVDLEPIFHFLQSVPSPSQNRALWESRYVLLLWLSLIVMIPFDLKRVDSAWGVQGKQTLVDSMLDLCKEYLGSTGKEHDGAAIVLARLLTRKDTSVTHLPSFLNWSTKTTLELADNPSISSAFLFKGLLTSLCYLYKLGLRDLLLPTLDSCIPICQLYFSEFASTNSLVRKLLMKLTQRIGMNYLKQKVAKWRYQRGQRSLDIKTGHVGDDTGLTVHRVESSADNEDHDDDEDEEVPEAVEEILDILLNGLRDKDTIVRWSAAKGVGRICHRLPKALAEDVIGSVIDLFSENMVVSSSGMVDYSSVSDSTWHGACLSLAELARRGLLLPDRLPVVVTHVAQALLFDQPRLTHSIGSHVRDAACYVAWSFARAYSPEVMQPFVPILAKKLVVVACYDREINVRRASAAAFQENVGRQGVFPHGIDIVTTADYFSVGNKANSFLDVSVEIARFNEYRQELIKHLADVTVKHWDRQIRELASKTLGRLTGRDLDFILQNMLPKLIETARVSDVNLRHGSLLFIAEICLSWPDVRRSSSTTHWINANEQSLVASILDILPSFSSSYLTTFGSDITRHAVCRLIECLALAQFPFTESHIRNYVSILQTTLERKEDWVVEAAVNAVRALARVPLGAEFIRKESVQTWTKNIEPKVDRFTRRGFALALGALPVNTVLDGMVGQVLLKLCDAAKMREDKLENDAESKRNAIFAIQNLINEIGRKLASDEYRSVFDAIASTLLNCMNDYSSDSRGDVGSWIRESAMNTFVTIVAFVKHDAAFLTPELSRSIVALTLQQSVEKIDRVRETAGKVLTELVHVHNIPFLEGQNVMPEVIPKSSDEVNWLAPADVFGRMVRVLHIPAYRIEFLTGLIVSVGGMTESLVKHASTQLVEFVSSLPVSHNIPNTSLSLKDFCDALLTVYKTNPKNDRVVVPVMDVIECLFAAGVFANFQDKTFYNELFDITKREVFKIKDVKKLTAGMKVFSNLMFLDGSDECTSEAHAKAVRQMVNYLIHPFPRVRRVASEQVYLAVTSNMLIEDDGRLMEFEQVMTGTDWDASAAECKPPKEKIAQCLGLSPSLSATSSTSLTYQDSNVSLAKQNPS